MAPKIAIIVYSMYGHIVKMAEAELAGIKAAGGSATIYQIPETLPENLLTILHAPPKPDFPIATVDTLKEYDGFLFGVPTRFGNFPSQWKSFWDGTGGLWATGALQGKYVGQFTSTGSLGAGQETTFLNAMSTYVHHGMIYVPLGFAPAFPQLTNISEVHGGSGWGAGTLAAGDGSRQPSALELDVATIQGKTFYETLAKAFP
ncbi:benzoquinone reductase [Lipomyces arxii]|uniref:benzoquinone reductase n=1 Tax=Lipomyces arxii TaxID=56418 RepID=UPI0034CF2293